MVGDGGEGTSSEPPRSLSLLSLLDPAVRVRVRVRVGLRVRVRVQVRVRITTRSCGQGWT